MSKTTGSCMLSRAVHGLLPLAALGVAAGAHAGDLAFESRVAGGYSDNVTRTAVDPQDETIASLGLKLSFDERSARSDVDLVGDLEYRDYLDSTYDSELIGNFVGDAGLALVEDHLRLVFTDNFGQVVDDPFLPVTPDNRENLNYFTTGLQGQTLFGSRTRLDLGATYGISTYERTPLDGTNLTGNLGVSRLISDASSLGLNARAADVRYDEESLAADEYRQYEGFLRYENDGARTRLATDLGYGSLDRKAAGTTGGLLLRLNVARHVSAHSTLLLGAGQEFSNSAQAFASAQSGGSVGISISPTRQTAQPFNYRHADLGWNITGSRTSIDLGVSWQDHRYEDNSGLDQTLTEWSGMVRRDLGAVLSTSVDASYSRGEFSNGGGDYSEFFGNLSMSWRLARRTAVSLSYEYSKRDSNAAGGGYQENQIWLSFGYQHGQPRDTKLSVGFGAGRP